MIEKMRTRRAIAAAPLLVVALVAAACGSSSNQGSAGQAKSPGNGTDLAFLEQMIPHHRSAIEMATIARARAQHPQIRSLAAAIVAAQRSEIASMSTLRDRLTAAGIKPADLGIGEHAMGMAMDMSSLRTANPFDRAFIDMMTPHHRGAVAMAKVELRRGRYPDVRRIARGIIAAQQREIAEMGTWRKRWYGSAGAMTHSMG